MRLTSQLHVRGCFHSQGIIRILLFVFAASLAVPLVSLAVHVTATTYNLKTFELEKHDWQRADSKGCLPIIGDKPSELSIAELADVATLEVAEGKGDTKLRGGAGSEWMSEGGKGNEIVLAAVAMGGLTVEDARLIILTCLKPHASSSAEAMYYLECRLVKQEKGQWVMWRQPYCILDQSGNNVTFGLNQPCDAGVMKMPKQLKGYMEAVKAYYKQHKDEVKFVPLLMPVGAGTK